MGRDSKNSPSETFERIKKVLEKNGYDVSSNEKIASAVNSSKSSVQRWKNSFPRMDDLIYISQRFSVSLDWLIYGKEQINSLVSKETDNQAESKNIQIEKPIEEYTTKDICNAFIALSNIADICCLNFGDIVTDNSRLKEWIKEGAIDGEANCEPLIIALRPKVECLWSLEPPPLNDIDTKNQPCTVKEEPPIGMLGDNRFSVVRNYLEYAFCETPYEDEHEIDLPQLTLNKILSAKLETLDIYPITPDIKTISAKYPLAAIKQKAIKNFESRRAFLSVCMTNFKIPEHDIDLYISVESLANFSKKHES